MGVEQLWLPPSAWRSELSLSDDPLQALSADEKGKLGHLQRQLQAEGLWNASLHDLYMLRRFLKARNWELPAARKMWADMIAFRANNQVERILHDYKFAERSAVLSLFPHGLHKTDRQGRPVLVYKFGGDLKALKTVTSDQRLVTYHIQEYERIMRVVLPACSYLAGRHIEKITTLIDVGGLSMGSAGSMIDLLKNFVSVDSNNYPETLGCMIIINVPFMLGAVFAGFKKFLPADTQKKMEVLDSKFHARLHQLIPPEHLLPEYGGTSHGSLGDSIGPWQDAVPALRKIFMRGTGQHMQEVGVPPEQQGQEQVDAKVAVMQQAGHILCKEVHHSDAKVPIAIHAQNGHHPHAQPFDVELREVSRALSPPRQQEEQPMHQGLLQPVHQQPPSPPQQQQPLSPGPHEQLQQQEPPAVLLPLELPLEMSVDLQSQPLLQQHEKPVVEGSSPPRKRPNMGASPGEGQQQEAPTIVLFPPGSQLSPPQQPTFVQSPAQQQVVQQHQGPVVQGAFAHSPAQQQVVQQQQQQQGPVVQIAPGGSLTVVSGSQNLEPFFSAALTDPSWQAALQTVTSVQADYVPGLDEAQGMQMQGVQVPPGQPKSQHPSPQLPTNSQLPQHSQQQQQEPFLLGKGAPLAALGSADEAVLVTPQGLVPMTLPGPLAAAFEAQANDPQAQVDRSSMHSFHSCRSHESAATSVTSRSMYSTASYATASLASGFGGSSRRSIGSGVRSKRAGGPAGSSVMSGGSATGRRRQTGVLMEEMMMVEEEEPHSGGLSSGHHLDQGRLQGDGPPGLYPSPGSHDLGVVVGSPTLGGGTGGAAGGGSAGGAPGGPSGVTSWVSAAQAGARKAIPLMVLRWFWGATPAGDGGAPGEYESLGPGDPSALAADVPNSPPSQASGALDRHGSGTLERTSGPLLATTSLPLAGGTGGRGGGRGSLQRNSAELVAVGSGPSVTSSTGPGLGIQYPPMDAVGKGSYTAKVVAALKGVKSRSARYKSGADAMAGGLTGGSSVYIPGALGGLGSADSGADHPSPMRLDQTPPQPPPRGDSEGEEGLLLASRTNSSEGLGDDDATAPELQDGRGSAGLSPGQSSSRHNQGSSGSARQRSSGRRRKHATSADVQMAGAPNVAPHHGNAHQLMASVGSNVRNLLHLNSSSRSPWHQQLLSDHSEVSTGGGGARSLTSPTALPPPFTAFTEAPHYHVDAAQRPAGSSTSAPLGHAQTWDATGGVGAPGTGGSLSLQPGLSSVLGGLMPDGSLGLPGDQSVTNHSMNGGGGYVPPAMIQHSRRGSAVPLAGLTPVGSASMGGSAAGGGGGGGGVNGVTLTLNGHGHTSTHLDSHPGAHHDPQQHQLPSGGVGIDGGRLLSTSPSVSSHLGDFANRGPHGGLRPAVPSLNGGANGSHYPVLGINGISSNPNNGGARATAWPVSTERFCDQPDSEDEGGRLLRDTGTGGYYNSSTGQYGDPSGKYRRSGFRHFLRRLLCTCCMAE